MAQQNLLKVPLYSKSSLPILAQREKLITTGRIAERLMQSLIEAKRDLQIVTEFRNKLRLTEDLIAKLAFSLREIQGLRRK
jgi:hypothetical protein